MELRLTLHTKIKSADLTPCGRPASSCLAQQTRPFHRAIGEQCPASRVKRKTTVRGFNSTDLIVDWPLQAALFGLAFSYACYIERPRGWADSSLIEVRDSQVHGRGVFTRTDIPTGTVLGSYPGRRRSSSQVVQKTQYAPGTKQYVYHLRDAVYLDPTDQHGQPSHRPSPGLPWFSIDPSMAFVNEPSLGSSVNVETTDGLDGNVVFRAVADLRKGEELYIDYGSLYDRSSYPRGA